MLDKGKQRQASSPYRGTGIWWPYVIVLVGLAAIIALVVQNDHRVDFEWLWIDFDASLAVMILATVMVSTAATSLAGLVWRRHRRHALERTRQATAERDSSERAATSSPVSEPARLPRDRS